LCLLNGRQPRVKPLRFVWMMVATILSSGQSRISDCNYESLLKQAASGNECLGVKNSATFNFSKAGGSEVN